MDISEQEFKRCNLVKPNGRIDSFTAPILAEALSKITEAGRFNIVLDLGSVDYVSSAGLRVMIDAQKTCKQANRGFVVLVAVPKRIYETLELAGFVPLFKFYDDVTGAVASF